MKRLLISLFTLCVWAFSLHAQNDEFNPVNPGDPQPFYMLQVQVSPAAGGTANLTRTMLTEGQKISLRISPNKDFKLQQWVCGDSVLSTDNYLYFTMPARNVVITAQMIYQPEEPEVFNPESPSDPTGQGEIIKRHLVTVYSSPSVGGYTNQSAFSMQEGEQRNLYAYPYAGYEFTGWMQDGVLFSKRNPMLVEMGERDLTYTAVFSFNPESPVDPNANSFDAVTGTLVIDRFTQGRLISAIYEVLGDNNYSAIRSATIIGVMDESDFGVLQDLQSCGFIDISRTDGFTVIPSWTFSFMTSLTTLILPSSVEQVESNAFYGSSISELILYALVPPIVQDNALDALPSSMTIRVPASALSLYQTSTIWNRFNLVAIDAQSLTVSLPNDAEDGRYKNMTLCLENQQSGQIQKYLITERNTYTFSNLLNNSNYTLSVKNNRGIVLGSIDNIVIENEDVSLTIDSLLTPINLTLKILTPEGEDITSSTTVIWSDEKGNYMAKGAVLTNVIEGENVTYNVTLSADKSSIYEDLPKESIVVNKEQIQIEKHLTKRSTITLSGTVVSSNSLSPVKGVYVSIAQSLKSKNSNIYFAETDNKGHFSVEVLNANATLYFTENSYLKHTLTIDTTQLGNLDTIKIQPLTGTALFISPKYIESVLRGIEQEVLDYYADYANIDFTVYNVTHQKPMQVVVKYPILTLPDKISLGDSITLTATSRNHKFNPSVSGARIDSSLYARINIPIVQLGAITATYLNAEADEVAALLFDNQGQLVQKQVFDGQQEVRFDNLDDGNYTIVCLENLQQFSSISRLSEFTSSVLTAGTDYFHKQVNVNSGWISTVQFDSVSSINRSLLFAGENMQFVSTSTQTIVGNYITLKAKIDLKNEAVNNISDVRFVFDLPDNTDFVNGSVMVDGKLNNNYTLSNGRLTVPLQNANRQVVFCITPCIEGIYTPCAYTQFKVAGEEIQIPIASVYYEVNGLTLNVPNVFASKTIKAGGTAIPNSTVEVYANDELIGTAQSLGNGSWSADCTFRDPANLSIMKVYASAVDKNGVKHISETYDCQYNQDAIEVSKVTMYHYNSYMCRTYETVFDFQNPQNKPENYYYYVDKVFSFDIDFTSNDTTKISDVVLYVETTDGLWTALDAVYNATKGKWTAQGQFNTDMSYNLPTNVSVDFHENIVHKVDSKAISNALQDFEDFKNSFLSGDVTGIDPYENIPQADLTQWLDSLNSLSEEEFDTWAIQWQQEIEELIQNVESINKRLENEMNATSLFRTDTICLNDTVCYTYSIIPSTTYNLSTIEKEGFRKIASTSDELIYEKSDSISYIRVDFSRDLVQVITIIDVAQPGNAPRRASGDQYYMNDVGNQVYQNVFSEAAGQIIEYGGDRVLMTPSERAYYNKLGDKMAKNKLLLELSEKPSGLSQLDRYSAKNQNMWRTNNEKMCETQSKILGKGAVASKAFGAGFALGSFVKDNYGKYNSINNILRPKCSKLEYADEIIAWNEEYEQLRNELNIHAAWQGVRNAAYFGLAFVPGVGLGVSLALAITEGLIESHFEDQFNAEFTDKVNHLSTKALVINRKCSKEKSDKTQEPKGKKSGNQDATHTLDPAGFVFEGVEDNRIEGVTATIFYKDSITNVFGERVEEEIMWDAAEFDQENPLYTDENGFYQWFVPQGLWQVRFEKEGYEPTQSEWLPVPPPQLEVNIPIVQLRQPEVINAIAHKDAIDITFDKYMLPSLLNTDNIYVMADNQVIAGSVVLLNEQHPYNDNTTSYASKIRFVPESEFTAKEITLTVSNRVHSYADVPMAQTFQQTFDVDGVGVVEQAALPVPSIESGSEVLLGTELSITCPTEGATIRYTLDGTTPDCLNGLVYKTPILLYGQQQITIQAVACADGYNQSDVAQWTYTFVEVKDDLQTAEQTSQQPTKVLQNGHIYILMPGGQKYTVVGTQVE